MNLKFYIIPILFLYYNRNLKVHANRTDVTSQCSTGLITGINAKYDIELNVLIHFANHTQESESLLRHLKTPKVLITHSKIVLPVFKEFTNRMLVVAFINDKVNVSDVIRMVKRVSGQSKITQILYICEIESLELRGLLFNELAKRSWQAGHIRVLAALNCVLYKFKSQPKFHKVQIERFEDAYDWKRFYDLQGYPIRFICAHDTPRCFKYATHGNTQYFGYLYKMFFEFTDHHNGTLIEVKPANTTTIISSVIRSLNHDEVDLGATLLHHSTTYGFVHVSDCPILMLAPYGHTKYTFLLFTQPFPKKCWIHFIIVLICAWGLIYGKQRVRSTKRPDLSLAFLAAYSRTLNIPLSFILRGHLNLSIFLQLLQFFGFVMSSYYTAKLSVSFRQDLFPPIINTIDDIALTNYKIAVTPYDYTILQQIAQLPDIIMQRMIIYTRTEFEVMLKNLDTSHAYIGVGDKLNFYYLQQQKMKLPLLKLLQVNSIIVPGFLPMAPDFPFVRFVKLFFLLVRENGMQVRIFEQTVAEGIKVGEISIREDQQPDQILLNLDYFHFPILLYCSGMLLASLVFIMETVKYCCA